MGSNSNTQNDSDKKLLSLADNRLYYLDEANYNKVMGLLKDAGDKLGENEYYQYTKMLCKVYSYDSAPN